MYRQKRFISLQGSFNYTDNLVFWMENEKVRMNDILRRRDYSFEAMINLFHSDIHLYIYIFLFHFLRSFFR